MLLAKSNVPRVHSSEAGYSLPVADAHEGGRKGKLTWPWQPLAEPALIITNISKVDDAGSVHFESVWTAQFIKSLVDGGLLKFQGNIRPDHVEGQRMGTKTRRKIEKWAMELLAGDAVIGNLSVRVNPDTALLETEVDDEGQESLIIQRGHLDTAVDSESRLKAIVKALNSPMGDRLKDARFAVRIWVVNDTTAKRVAANYNTRGEKVNDSAAASSPGRRPQASVWLAASSTARRT